MLTGKNLFLAKAALVGGGALQLLAAILAFAPTDAAVNFSTPVDVSCPGREATKPARLHVEPRQGDPSRPPRRTSGSACAAPFLRNIGVAVLP
jgi:hypothetical protein